MVVALASYLLDEEHYILKESGIVFCFDFI